MRKVGLRALPDRYEVLEQPELHVQVGIVVGGGLMGLLYWHWGNTDKVAIQELQHFRQEMATQCKQDQFAKPAPKELSSLYADSKVCNTGQEIDTAQKKWGSSSTLPVNVSVRSKRKRSASSSTRAAQGSSGASSIPDRQRRSAFNAKGALRRALFRFAPGY